MNGNDGLGDPHDHLLILPFKAYPWPVNAVHPSLSLSSSFSKLTKKGGKEGLISSWIFRFRERIDMTNSFSVMRACTTLFLFM